MDYLLNIEVRRFDFKKINNWIKKGVSWSIGGDYTFKKLISFPNILREYNPKLKGYSTKTSLTFGKGQNSSHNGLNVGKWIL